MNSAPAQAQEKEEILLDIEARTFKISVSRRSRSNKTYLFDDLEVAQPKEGKILLLRRDDVPMMAFRVVKLYPQNKQFAGKRIARYGNVRVLPNAETYLAIEKVGDVALPPLTDRDRADLRELEAAAAGHPSSEGRPDLTPASPDVDDDEDLGLGFDEVLPLDPYTHWLTARFTFLRNQDPTGGIGYFAAGGLSYGATIARRIFLARKRSQDALVLEGSLYYYTLSNYVSERDSYALLPFSPTLRYNLQFGEGFWLFFYGGIIFNNVINQSVDIEGSLEVAQRLSATQPAFGGGMMFRLGPGWLARFELGYDQFALGVVLRF